ncbi:MAG: DUF3445 domain-containing protein [Rhodobacteraceae bacterium]|nr:DUF3445 domain-containing protein [Paracoccaceae bacterium]
MPWMDPRLSRLPGIQPLAPGDWIRVDEAYAGQMAERERLIAACPERVHAILPCAAEAADELLDAVQDLLPGLGFVREGAGWRRPDGQVRAVDRAAPLLTLGQLVQEDLCILEEGTDGAHVLTGAILCFPASWTLAEKIGRGLPGIHTPVAGYAGALEARVQRLFDAIRPEQGLWRANALDYVDPALFQPRREAETRPKDRQRGGFIRSERQCLVRLPRTRAVVFSIHTYVVPRATLTPEEEAAFTATYG